MAPVRPRVKNTLPAAPAPSNLLWPMATTETVVQSQRVLWNACTAWQQSLLVWNRDLYDQWACRFGGGVPIDG